MSLQVHDFFTRYADQDVPTMILDGDVIVAHVHHPEYLRLFLYAPEMVSLIEKLGAMECDPSRPEHDSDTCAVCQARILLAIMQQRTDDRLTADRSKLDMLG
jgi:hypothetical protein